MCDRRGTIARREEDCPAIAHNDSTGANVDLLAHLIALVAVPSAIARPVATPDEKPGDWIGRYKLLQKIGEGGCGAVRMGDRATPTSIQFG